MAPRTRCLGVDDHPVVRQGLDLLFGHLDDLERGIRTGAGGTPFVDPSLSPALLMPTAASDDQPLSEREREILQLLAEGYHTEEIARRIGLSVETVKSDTKRVILKLQADTRTHAVAIALRQAIIEEQPCASSRGSGSRCRSCSW